MEDNTGKGHTHDVVNTFIFKGHTKIFMEGELDGSIKNWIK